MVPINPIDQALDLLTIGTFFYAEETGAQVLTQFPKAACSRLLKVRNPEQADAMGYGAQPGNGTAVALWTRAEFAATETGGWAFLVSVQHLTCRPECLPMVKAGDEGESPHGYSLLRDWFVTDTEGRRHVVSACSKEQARTIWATEWTAESVTGPFSPPDDNQPWWHVTATYSAGSQIQLRLQAADAPDAHKIIRNWFAGLLGAAEPVHISVEPCPHNLLEPYK